VPNKKAPLTSHRRPYWIWSQITTPFLVLFNHIASRMLHIKTFVDFSSETDATMKTKPSPGVKALDDIQ
jgi:hypothetical protein